jgi:hypothetical protein
MGTPHFRFHLPIWKVELRFHLLFLVPPSGFPQLKQTFNGFCTKISQLGKVEQKTLDGISHLGKYGFTKRQNRPPKGTPVAR